VLREGATSVYRSVVAVRDSVAFNARCQQRPAAPARTISDFVYLAK
jgi:hypothetical protein